MKTYKVTHRSCAGYRVAVRLRSHRKQTLKKLDYNKACGVVIKPRAERAFSLWKAAIRAGYALFALNEALSSI